MIKVSSNFIISSSKTTISRKTWIITTAKTFMLWSMPLLNSTWRLVIVTLPIVKENRRVIPGKLTNSSLLTTTRISKENCLRFLDSKCHQAPTMRAHQLNSCSRCKLRLREQPALMAQEIAMEVERKPAIPRKSWWICATTSYWATKRSSRRSSSGSTHTPSTNRNTSSNRSNSFKRAPAQWNKSQRSSGAKTGLQNTWLRQDNR